ncbi:MAG: pilus assembly protein TadG-related protein, partial [Myxococcota bacterium]
MRFARVSRRRGNTATIVALSMTGLIGFAALTIDMGYARLVHQQLENTSEAAARAGAARLDGT